MHSTVRFAGRRSTTGACSKCRAKLSSNLGQCRVLAGLHRSEVLNEPRYQKLKIGRLEGAPERVEFHPTPFADTMGTWRLHSPYVPTRPAHSLLGCKDEDIYRNVQHTCKGAFKRLWAFFSYYGPSHHAFRAALRDFIDREIRPEGHWGLCPCLVSSLPPPPRRTRTRPLRRSTFTHG